jgi:hypothetical protein
LIFIFTKKLPKIKTSGREEGKIRKQSEEYLLVNFPCDIRKNLRGILLAADKKSSADDDFAVAANTKLANKTSSVEKAVEKAKTGPSTQKSHRFNQNQPAPNSSTSPPPPPEQAISAVEKTRKKGANTGRGTPRNLSATTFFLTLRSPSPFVHIRYGVE